MTDSAIFLSVVSPIYQAEATVGELVQRLIIVLESVSPNFEIILVDDGSPDDSWARILEQTARDARVRGIGLSRNFGQHSAITAGLDCSRGEWIVVMDCDLQDRPEEIPALVTEAYHGYDLVLARRVNRRDLFGTKILSNLFYRILSYLSERPQDASVANFGIYNRKVIDAVLSIREAIRYFPAMTQWVGFRTSYLNVTHAPRANGVSGYSFGRRLQLGLDILLAYSDKPLWLTIKLGLILSGGAFLFVPITLFRYWTGQISQPGYASLMVSIWFFSGLLLSVLGMVGLYVGKTFEQAKQRPIYIVAADTDAMAA